MAAIIFDFDGTLADTFETVLHILGELMGHEGPIDQAEVGRLRGMSMMKAAEELRIKPWRMPFMVMRGRRKMSKRIDAIQVVPGMPEVIKKLQNEGHQLFILSTNSVKNIEKFLVRHELIYAFARVYGNVGLLNKARIIKKVVKQNQLDPNETWYVGDEVRDIIGAKHADIRIMAVTWGYNTPAILKKHEPTTLVDTPADIIRTLEEA
jgi:phosphoglycolate phosphatase-like HAD superfamily hydrolase